MTRVRKLAALAPLLATLGAVGLAWLAVGVGPSRAGAPTELLPDLDVITPQGLLLQVTTNKQGKRFKLGFISAAQNVGSGPIIVRGERTALDVTTMRADQIVQRSDGSTSVYLNVGYLKFFVDPSHEHWHLLPFMVYEIRRATDYKLMRPDEKQGFCLGDRYKSPTLLLPSTPPAPVYTFDCGGKEPTLLSLEEGISVGYGDDYTQIREGQVVDLTGLPAGRYYLVHRVNKNGQLREASYANNVSSLLLQLSWPKGPKAKPKVAILAACTNTDRCKKGFFFDRLK